MLFLQVSHTLTHTLICWKQPSRFSFRYRTPNTATLTHAYTLCSCRPPVRHQAFRSAAGCDIIMAPRRLVLPNPAHPNPSLTPITPPRPAPPLPRCCMSVNQCNLRFHVRLGSNDNNNMVIIITVIICYCVCVLFQVGAQFSSVSA